MKPFNEIKEEVGQRIGAILEAEKGPKAKHEPLHIAHHDGEPGEEWHDHVVIKDLPHSKESSDHLHKKIAHALYKKSPKTYGSPEGAAKHIDDYVGYSGWSDSHSLAHHNEQMSHDDEPRETKSSKKTQDKAPEYEVNHKSTPHRTTTSSQYAREVANHYHHAMHGGYDD